MVVLAQRGERRPERRDVIYCLIPAELAPRLHELLRRHFRERPEVEVIVERRSRERRRGAERRDAASATATAAERRRVRAAAGRRAGERRAGLSALKEVPELPRRARRYAAEIAFVRRLEPPSERAEDLDTARLVARYQAGDADAFATLYARYFDRVYGYLRLVLRDSHEAEDATQQVFTQVFEALPGYERRSQPFRGWLFIVARNHAVSQLRKRHELAVAPETMERQLENNGLSGSQRSVLDWMSDRDFLALIERLPLTQRHVLALRFMLDLDTEEIAAIVGREPNTVRQLQHRALRTLEGRLAALGHGPRRGARATPRSRMRAWPKRAPVLRARRFSLMR